MSISPIIPIWAIVAVAVVLGVPVVWRLVTAPAGRTGFRTRWRARMPWIRRALMVLLIIGIGLRPVSPDVSEQHSRMNANVFFVVDRTGSMNAEDMDGGGTRLDAVKQDISSVLEATAGSRYSIIAFDSDATQQLPLTTDAQAVTTWANTLAPESTQYSKGSNLDRSRDVLTRAVTDAVEDDPDSYAIVYFFSDGENTDGQQSETFDELNGKIDAGAVYGYGTSAGGRMKSTGAGSDGGYIQDPSTGTDALSKIDEQTLQTLAGQLGVQYAHRTGPPDVAATLTGVTLKSIPITEESRDITSDRDWYWIGAIALAACFIWELVDQLLAIPRRVSARDALMWKEPR